MSESERLAWARLVLAERALRAQEAVDDGGMAAHAAREEVDCAEHDLRRVVLELGRYLPEFPPPLRMPKPTPARKAEEAAILREMRIVRMADLLGVEFHRGEIVGCRQYTGDYATPIDFDVARGAVEAFTSAPVGYSLDMGQTDDGRTLVVEVNDAFALGSYGLPSVRYADLVLDRWAEIVGLLEVRS